MVKKYIPKQGDIVYLDFNPTKGHEQKGRRPAIVISNNIFNNNTKMVIVCPITTNQKDFPTHYLLKDTKCVTGSVLLQAAEHSEKMERAIKCRGGFKGFNSIKNEKLEVRNENSFESSKSLLQIS